MKLTITFVFVCLTTFLFSQNFSSNDPDYITNVTLGEKALNETNYDSCMVYYRKAFKIKQTSVLSTLRMAACAYSGGYRHAYTTQLQQSIDLSWGTTKSIFDNYPEFEYLKNTTFESRLNALFEASAKAQGINIELMNELNEIRKTDQAQRQEMGDYEWGTPAMDSLWKLQNYSDSINTIRVIEMIEEYGYPGKSLVGQGQMGTAFLVIQHADIDVQQKYLPVLQKAADEGELSKSSLALLIDRVRLRTGEKQLYGSQIGRTEDGVYYVSPLEDPETVDQRREEMGLPPLDDYCKNWNFDWDVEAHRKIWVTLPEGN